MIAKRATELSIDTNLKYHLVLMKQTNKDIHLSSYKDILKNTFNTSIHYSGIRMAIIDENSCVFLIPVDNSISAGKKLRTH